LIRSRRRRSIAECDTLRIRSRVSWSTSLALEDPLRRVVVAVEPEPEPDALLRACDLDGLRDSSVDGVAASAFDGEDGDVVAGVDVLGGGNIVNRRGEPGADRSPTGALVGELCSEALRGRIVE
jgi:hypothetical protein